MKTTAYISRIATRVSILTAIVMAGLGFSACSSDDDEPTAYSNEETVKSAHVTFTYTVPQELLEYAEITIFRNNNEGTDEVTEPMLDSKVSVTYDLAHFPITAPVVFVYRLTNRPADGVNVNWDLKMDTEVVLDIDGRNEVKTNSEIYTISGDAGAGLTKLMQSPLDRTYAVKIAKNGTVQFVH